MKVAMVGEHNPPIPFIDEAMTSAPTTASLAASLVRLGHRVTVYTVGDQVDDVERIDTAYGYRVVRAPADADASGVSAEVAPFVGDLARLLVEEWTVDRPDVVHALTWTHGIATQLAGNRLGLPTVQTLPVLSATARRRQHRPRAAVSRERMEVLLARNAACVTAACTEDVDELVRLGCSRSRVSVLPRGIDVDLVGAVQSPTEEGHHRRIVAVARKLRPDKGFDVLIRAMTKLPDAELVIVGGPPADQLSHDEEACRLRRLAEGLGVLDRVRLTGELPHLAVLEVLRSAHAFACPSRYEPVGLPVLEAMACGLPVVASAAGGMLDTVVHEVTGTLVPPGDSARFILALREMLGQDTLRMGMGLAGRDRVRSRYSWDRVAADASTTYEHAVARSATLAAGRSPARPPTHSILTPP
ncbi:glycosyltransferase [Mycobacterium sp. URHB0044]|uniref:glycosyltransferase n=1 Tax=Mycobacterium sp. URHB0044 TaxID=1380386 RepID=UPI000688833C|nr:glycosyltransferase [Mycobacterium sp. URHB0044]